MLDLNLLLTFEAIYRERHLGRAAEEGEEGRPREAVTHVQHQRRGHTPRELPQRPQNSRRANGDERKTRSVPQSSPPSFPPPP